MFSSRLFSLCSPTPPTLLYINLYHQHDAQMDYYGKKLATCSSDRTIKVFEVSNEKHTLLAELKGHEGPVWQVCWSHPKFGNVLASCSYDRRVIMWKETNAVWSKVYEYSNHDSSINSICWAPHEYGLLLACASSDGYVSVLSARGDGVWDQSKFPAHHVGCNSVSWAPSIFPGALVQPGSRSSQNPVGSSLAPRRFVTGGSDNLVKIWKFEEAQNTFLLEDTLEGHTDWVRDVAWAPNIGLPSSTIASCGQDGNVFVWSCDPIGNQDPQNRAFSGWTKKLLSKYSDVVWRVSWSLTGNILAVSGGDGRVSLWKESLEGNWSCVSEMEDTSNPEETHSVQH
eukprot:Sdes_comp15888_c0_seq2m5001